MNASQETFIKDPLLAIFGSGRLTDSLGSQCSQDEELAFSCLNAYKEPESDMLSTNIRKPLVNQTSKDKPVDHLKSRNNQTVSPDAECHSLKEDNDVESNHGSMDLFSSQPIHGSLIEEHIDITLQLTEFVWVQCDNADCQKWRRIPASDAEHLEDDPWYCFMSTDPNRNMCSAEEEDHLMYDRMAKKAGIKFVMSMLGLGSLVWAKMAGYCRWPAIVTRDPEIGCHVLIDIDGDPYSYHVEFLGKTHSHSWIAAKFIEVYGHKAQSGLDDSLSQTDVQTRKKKRKGCGRGRHKKKKLTNFGAGKKKKSYKRMHIDGVIQEADFLLDLDQGERLNYSLFKYDPYKQIKSEKREKAGSRTSCEKCSQCKKKGRKRKEVSAGVEENNFPGKTILESLGEKNSLQPGRRRSEGGGQKKMKTGNLAVFDYTSDGATSKCEISLDEGISVETVKTEVSMFDSPDQFSQSGLKFMNSMMDKSKEEKFSIDIDMYRKNEAAFEHDVRRFMKRNGQSIRNTPVWHTVPVRLFQLYLAVLERGGFEQVNKKKQWSAVYKELTEQQHVSCGTVAKKYYQNNLYPYELYMTGGEYESILKEKRKCESKKQEKKSCQTPKTVENKANLTTADIKGKSDALPAHIKDDSTTLSQVIEGIIAHLEEDYSTEKCTDEPNKKAGVKFHDDPTESSQVEHRVPSEFQPSSSAGDIQEVPRSISDDSLSDIEENILHEMKALEDDIKEIGHLD